MNTEELGSLIARADAQRDRLLTTVEAVDARRHPRVRTVTPVAVVALATMGVVGLAMAWVGARRTRPPRWTLLAAATGASGIALSALVATHHSQRTATQPPVLPSEAKAVVMLPEFEGPAPKPVTRRAWFWVLTSLLLLLAASLSLGR